MRIYQKLSDKISAQPKALSVLQNIGDVTTYHEDYGVRHPLASYNVSILNVAKRILSTLNVLEEAQNMRAFESPKNKDWEAPLTEATDHMLDALMEHMDDCGGILRSFFPSSSDVNFKKIFNEFKKSVDPYRNHIGAIVNYIKHNQGRLRSISFSWSDGSSLGYFVEGPIAGGGLGPVSTIHPTGNTAFSYNRDIPYHICNLYAVSANLASALYSVDKKLVASKKQPKTVGNPSELSQVLDKAASLPMFFFEDELSKGVPKITTGSKYFTIDYPANKAKPNAPPGGSRIAISFRGDGVTSSFKMPYFNEKS